MAGNAPEIVNLEIDVCSVQKAGGRGGSREHGYGLHTEVALRSKEEGAERSDWPD